MAQILPLIFSFFNNYLTRNYHCVLSVFFLISGGRLELPYVWYCFYMTCGFSRAPICTPWFYFKLMFLVQSICFVWHCHCSCYYYSTDTIVPISMPIPMLDWTCTWLTNQKRGQICPPCHMAISGYIAKLSFNFNYILVESWDSFILN